MKIGIYTVKRRTQTGHVFGGIRANCAHESRGLKPSLQTGNLLLELEFFVRKQSVFNITTWVDDKNIYIISPNKRNNFIRTPVDFFFSAAVS